MCCCLYIMSVVAPRMKIGIFKNQVTGKNAVAASLLTLFLLTCEPTAAPLPDATKTIVGQVWTGLHVLQDLFQ